MITSSISLGIEPVGDLKSTAELLGSILGVTFEEAPSGRFDEYPGFVADQAGVSYSLLGLPDPEHDIRDVQANDFELIVHRRGSDLETLGDLVSVLFQNQRLRCWRL